MRCFAVAAVIAYAIVTSDFAIGTPAVALLSGGYLAFSLAAQSAWNVNRGFGAYLFGITLMLDALYMVGFAFASGWLESPLTYLAIVHLVVVALLASYRTGMKLALWDSLLLVVMHEAQKADLLTPAGGAAPLSFGRLAVSTRRLHGRCGRHRHVLRGQRA